MVGMGTRYWLWALRQSSGDEGEGECFTCVCESQFQEGYLIKVARVANWLPHKQASVTSAYFSPCYPDHVIAYIGSLAFTLMPCV